MTEITAEGPVSTTTVIDSKNGAIPIPHMKVSKRSVSEDFATTFSSPAAWLLVAALIVTWSAVAIVMFDLVDYKTLAGQSVSKFATDPLKLLHGAVEETTNSVYGFLSLMSDLIFEDEEEGEKGDVQPSMKVKEEVQPMVKKKEIQIDKPEKEEKIEKKALPREIQTEKPKKEEKVEKKLPPKLSHKEKPEKPEKVKKPEKPEKLEKPVKKEVSKVIQKEKPERHEKPEKREKPEKKRKTETPEKPEKKGKVLPKEKAAKQEKPTKKPAPSPKVTEKVKPERQQKIEEKVSPKDKKSAKVEEKTKKDVKERKPESKAPEKVTSKEAQVEEVRPAKGKGKDKEEAALVLAEKSDTKDQYEFCRYMIDMFAHGDLYTGPAPHLFLSQIPAITPAFPAAEVGTPNVTAVEPKKEAKRRKEVPETKATHGVKTKEAEDRKKVTHEKKIIPEIKAKALEEEKKVTHEKKAVSEMKTKGGKEERKKALGKTAVPEVKKAEPEKAPAAQPASVKAAAPAKQPVKDVPIKASVTQETHHKLKDAERTKIQPAAHLTKKAVHEKKEDRLLKAVEQDVAKEKLKFPTAMKEKEAGKPKEVKPTQKQKADVIKETKETSHRLTAGQEVIKHGKDVPQRKPEITVADKKKTEKPLKEKERKMAEVTHLKEEKAKVPAVKESHHHHNMTTDKLSKAAKTTAVRYYQCVFVNGYNDHKAQHPVTPAPDYKGKTVQSTKASGHKIKTLKQ